MCRAGADHDVVMKAMRVKCHAIVGYYTTLKGPGLTLQRSLSWLFSVIAYSLRPLYCLNSLAQEWTPSLWQVKEVPQYRKGFNMAST